MNPLTALPGSTEVSFKERHFPEASWEEWNDWRWQLKNRVRDLQGLEAILDLSDDERSAIVRRKDNLPLGISPYYLSLLDPDDPDQPLRRTVVPVLAEFDHHPGEYSDPLGEDKHSPVPGLIHTYPDKVLFWATDFCATYCRYCTRSRMVGAGEFLPDKKQWLDAIAYIERTPRIRDVLISGGDPLILSDERLEWLLDRLKAIPHVEFLRIGSKVPVVLPQRITTELIDCLKKYHPLWMSIHFSHPDELTPEVETACRRLADAGIPMGSQTVLLKGINDDLPTMKALMHGLLKLRVTPYYLHQCDAVEGSWHFRTSIQTGLDLVKGLHGHTTGYAVPQYMLDAPGGGGKVPLTPDYIVGVEGDELLVRNYAGKLYRYRDPGRGSKQPS